MVTYSAQTPTEYLAILDDDWRRDKLLAIRKDILKNAPGWTETINYKMLGFGPAGQPRIHLNAQKHYVGLYIGDIKKLDPDGSLVGHINNGKSCVRFRKKDEVGTIVGTLVERYVELKKQGIELIAKRCPFRAFTVMFG